MQHFSHSIWVNPMKRKGKLCQLYISRYEAVNSNSRKWKREQIQAPMSMCWSIQGLVLRDSLWKERNCSPIPLNIFLAKYTQKRISWQKWEICILWVTYICTLCYYFIETLIFALWHILQHIQTQFS